MIKVFVVILNWNQPKLTSECLESMDKAILQTIKTPKKAHCEVVVVDNGSSDNSVDEFHKTDWLTFNLKVIATGKNLGFAGGNNLGIKYALENNADYIVILNNDTIVDKNLISELLKTIESDPKIGIVSPKIYFAKGYEFQKDYKKSDLGKVLWYAGGKIDWKNIYGQNRGVDEVDRGQYDKTEEIDFATGACFMVRASALKEIGIFDERYFMYLEDMDLSIRAKRKGWKIIYVPTAKLWHKVAQSSGIGSSLNDYFISRNRLLFGMKYASLRTKLALLRESVRLFIFGRHWQAVGIRDYFMRRFGKGSWV